MPVVIPVSQDEHPSSGGYSSGGHGPVHGHNPQNNHHAPSAQNASGLLSPPPQVSGRLSAGPQPGGNNPRITG